MAKKPKVIRQAVPLGGQLYTGEQVDELEQVLTPKQGQRLLEKGAIEGDWDFGGEEPSKAPEPVPGPALATIDPSEVAASYISGTFSIPRSSDESAAEFLAGFVTDARKVSYERDSLREAAKSHAAVMDAASEKLISTERARDNAPSEVKRLKNELEQTKKAKPTPSAAQE